MSVQEGKRLRVLVACEFSGIVREAFRKRGHDAVSCDLLPTEQEGPHIQGDVLSHLDDGWDLLIAHPPCTFLSYMGNCRANEPGRVEKRESAMEFFMKFVNAGIPKIAIENPKGWPWRLYRRPDQILQPYEFGHDHSKATCLWLKNLPRLFCKFTFGKYQRRWDGKRFRTFVDLTPTFDVKGGNPRSITLGRWLVADSKAQEQVAVTERQKAYEARCQEIANDLGRFIESRGISAAALLAKGNLIDLFRCIRDSYGNGRYDEQAAYATAPAAPPDDYFQELAETIRKAVYDLWHKAKKDFGQHSWQCLVREAIQGELVAVVPPTRDELKAAHDEGVLKSAKVNCPQCAADVPLSSTGWHQFPDINTPCRSWEIRKIRYSGEASQPKGERR